MSRNFLSRRTFTRTKNYRRLLCTNTFEPRVCIYYIDFEIDFPFLNRKAILIGTLDGGY